VHSCGQLLLLCHAGEEFPQGGAFLARERGAQGVFMRLANDAQLSEQLLAISGEVQRVRAPVGFSAAAFDQIPVLHVIHQGDKATGRRTEPGRVGLLAQSGRRRDHAKQSGPRRGQIQYGNARGEARGGVRAELCQQKRNASPRSIRTRSCFRHSRTIALEKWYTLVYDIQSYTVWRSVMAPRPQSGPPLIAPGLAYAALTIAGIAVAAGVPRPNASPTDVLAYAQSHATAMRLSAFLALGAAVPLAIWSAAVYRRLRALGITAPGSAIALVGGVLASGFAASSGLIGWVASRADDSAPVAAALRDLSFMTGGPAFVAFFGLLLAGVSVPMLVLGIARPAAIAGLVLAAVAELSTLTLLTLNAAITMPIARFGGIAWLIAVSLLLPVSRPRGTGAAEVQS